MRKSLEKKDSVMIYYFRIFNLPRYDVNKNNVRIVKLIVERKRLSILNYKKNDVNELNKLKL